VISQRVRMAQAGAIKQRLAMALGEAVDIHGDVRFAFPDPWRLRQCTGFPGLTEQKVARLHAIADAAIAGQLDAQRLRDLPPDRALAEL